LEKWFLIIYSKTWESLTILLTLIIEMNYITNITKKVKRQILLRGLFKTLLFILVKAFKSLFKKNRKGTYLQNKKDAEFDDRYKVDTKGIIKTSELEINNRDWIYYTAYQAINQDDFCNNLNDLKLAFELFTFVDIGAGKGRAILLASTYPFKQIIGIGISEKLVNIAKKNLLSFPEDLRKCFNVELLCIDAVEFEIPKVPCVIYLYNPFDEPIMQKIVQKIIKSYNELHRRMVILYFAPTCGHIFDKIEIFEKKLLPHGLYIYEIKNFARINT